jgi:hypothetical protein
MTKARSNAVAEAAKGDLSVGSGTNLAGILAVGNNGETLVADSSTSTGLRYTAGTVQANPILNSAFQVWQRGTSIVPTTTTYSADRWQAYRGGTGATVSRQATGDTTNLPNIQYCARVQRDSGNASTLAIYLAQSFESINSIPYAGKTVTFSYYARKGANYSQASGNVSVSFMGAATTDANVLTSMSGTQIASVGGAVTTTWQRFTATATVSASYTQLGFYLEFNPVGTAGAADYVEVTGFQIDIGSVALPFRTYAATIQGELAACQRYYQALANFGCAGYSSGNIFSIMNTLPFVTAMRATPTVTITSTGTSQLLSSASIQSASPTSAVIQVVASGAGFSGIYGATTATASIEL